MLRQFVNFFVAFRALTSHRVCASFQFVSDDLLAVRGAHRRPVSVQHRFFLCLSLRFHNVVSAFRCVSTILSLPFAAFPQCCLYLISFTVWSLPFVRLSTKRVAIAGCCASRCRSSASRRVSAQWLFLSLPPAALPLVPIAMVSLPLVR